MVLWVQVRHVDNNSRCADLVPEPEDDMTFRVGLVCGEKESNTVRV